MSRTREVRAAIGAIRFAIAFAQDTRVAKLDESQVQTLQGGLLRFCWTAASGVGLVAKPDMVQIGSSELGEFQREVCALLEGIVVAREESSPPLGPGAVAAKSISIGGRGSLPLKLNAGLLQQLGVPGEACVSFTGSVRDVFLGVLLFALLLGDRDRITRCPACRRLFYRVGRQKCCSRKCTGQIYWKHYPKTKTGQRAINRSRRKYYEDQGWEFGARAKRAGTRAKGAP